MRNGNYSHPIIIKVASLLDVLFSLGNLISIENMNDPHDQKILRGHDMLVC